MVYFCPAIFTRVDYKPLLVLMVEHYRIVREIIASADLYQVGFKTTALSGGSFVGEGFMPSRSTGFERNSVLVPFRGIPM